MYTTGVLTPLSAIADALDWPTDRVRRAVDHLDEELRRVGLRIHRLNSTVSLRQAVDAVGPDALAGALRRHLARDGISLSEARMLHQLALGTRKRTLSNAETVALGVLGNAELISYGPAPDKSSEAPVLLTDDVRYSLMLDNTPAPAPAPARRATRTRTRARGSRSGSNAPPPAAGRCRARSLRQ